MSSSDTRQLFGGAITVTLPARLIDASELRQVPDTQEVFLYPDSDTSIIIEILERVKASDALAAARFHFDSLAHDNDALSSDILDVVASKVTSDMTIPPIVLSGKQQVRKFNRPTPDEVRILMAIYRVETQGVDLVLTLNSPIQTVDDAAHDDADWEAVRETFRTAANSLRIVDFGLFV